MKTRALAPILIALTTAGHVAADEVTYSRDVAPILNANCVSCHRPDQTGPMALRTYDEVRPWAKAVARNVKAGLMPPWHANPEYGHFANDRSLEPQEIETIVNWAKAGAPEGDPADLPELAEFPGAGWRLGEPDYVVTLEEVTVPAGGPDQFHDLVGKVMLPEDRWITAVEILPGNAKVVHHVIAFGIKGFDPDPQGGWLGAWAAGTAPMVFPEGTGRLLEKGANILADMHYHPTDTEQVDVTRIGLHFADATAPIEKELTNTWIMNTSFEIPAGDGDYEVRASHTFWQDGQIMAFAPHMHYRGKDFTYTATYPDGRREILMKVDDYDFAWQTNYVLAQPIAIPAGTEVECVAHYDNSKDNPDNPDPSRNVRFGNESYDEMMIGFLDFIVNDGVRPETPQETRERFLQEWSSQHPDAVYGVTTADSESVAPLYLPKSGDGYFAIIFNDNLVRAAVSDIEWEGGHFTAKVENPYGDPMPLEGELAEDGASIEATLAVGDERKIPFSGSRSST